MAYSALLRGLVAALMASTLALIVGFSAPTAEAASRPWQGTVIVSSAKVRSAPNSKAPVVATIPAGKTVTVVEWVSGEEVDKTNTTWAVLDDGEYVYSAAIQKIPPAGPPERPQGVSFPGRWIDVNITEQVLTAYEGNKPVRTMVISAGRPEYPSPQGTFRIQRRAESVTMDSANLPWVRDTYRLENVHYAQYFNEFGAALHEAYWKTPESFGIPTSHGCVGMPLAEARWLWNWADMGTPVHLHP